MTALLRAPVERDIAALAQLGRDTFVATFPDIYTQENLARFLIEAYAPDTVAAEMAHPKRRFIVAEMDGRLVGYCKIALEVTLDHDPGDVPTIELKQLYLTKDAQGQKLGDRFMEWVTKQAQACNAKAILLSVFSENYQAQRFYKRHGFVHIADTVFMVGDHADHEFLYLKHL